MIIFLDGILMKFHINNYKKICNSCKNYLSIMWCIIILKKSKESFLLFSHSLYNPFSEIFNFQLVSLFKDFSFSLRKPQKYTRPSSLGCEWIFSQFFFLNTFFTRIFIYPYDRPFKSYLKSTIFHLRTVFSHCYQIYVGSILNILSLLFSD